MLLINILRHDIAVIINVIFIVFSDCDYELRRFKINRKLISSILIALRHRFIKERNNITSVFYIFNKANIFLISHFFNITRLSLTCLDRDICFYINVFFYVHIFFSLSCLIYIHLYDLTLC